MSAKVEENGGDEVDVGVAEVRNVRQRYCMFVVTVACVIVTSVQLAVVIQRDSNVVELRQQVAELQQTVARLQHQQRPQDSSVAPLDDTRHQHELHNARVSQQLNFHILPYELFVRGTVGQASGNGHVREIHVPVHK